MVKPGLYPTSAPRSTESHGERAVYDAMARGLSKGWYAWHSQRIRVPGQPDAETDFVIADPVHEFLIIEVKGGLIEKYDLLNCRRLGQPVTIFRSDERRAYGIRQLQATAPD